VASTGIALQHKLAHAAGGTLNLPQAETHAILLPHAIAYNGAAMEEETLGQLAEALSPGTKGTALERVVDGLNGLVRDLGIPRGLKELGMREEDVERGAGGAVEKPYCNPRTVEKEKVREIFRRAWVGEEARVGL
jgi:alcohol dehydrogenase class IV